MALYLGNSDKLVINLNGVKYCLNLFYNVLQILNPYSVFFKLSE
jgi:hypothetical protein